MKLIIGLGNPGEKYQSTRHNVGYDCVELLANQHQASFKYESRFEGHLAIINLEGQKTILLKPTTYMNLSGRSVQKVMNYFKITQEDILVVSDDTNLDLGRIRLRLSGGSGGHNGLKDIINVLSSEAFKRMRIGISDDSDKIDFVLGKFSKEERKIIDDTLITASNAIIAFIKDVEFERIMSMYNTPVAL